MKRRRRVSSLAAFMVVVSAVGVPLFGILVAELRWDYVAQRPWVLLAMGVVLIAGEMMPIPVARRADVGDEVTISSTVALALVMVSPLGFAVLAQAVALIADEARSRRKWDRLVFNVAQYTIALYTARVVYEAVQGHTPSYWRPELPPNVIPIALCAAVVFFLVNNLLTDSAVSLKSRTPLARHMISDFRYQVTTSGALLALAPLTAIAVQSSLWTLPLLLLPIAAVHRSTRLAYAREHEALHDSLTGLANRTLFAAQLERACSDAVDYPVAAMLIDVDHFKEINDTLGHHAGDLLLKEIALRLREAVREGDLVARLGGDEFAVLAPGITSARQAQPLLHRLSTALHDSLVVHGVRVDVSASMGVALAPADATEAEQLLQRADVALYAAKRNRGSTTFYDAQDDDHSIERLSLLGELRRGLDVGQVHLAYQPKVSLVDGSVVGVEALVRWHHPTLGVLGPSRFIPLAENTGLIDAMTVQLIDQGLTQIGQWMRGEAGISLAVNLSARLLSDVRFVDQVERLLTQHGVDPALLTLEVTESMIMADTSRTLTVLRRLRDVGVRISIDDFGTGYSSLAYLKRLAVDELKVDRAFVSGMAHDRHDAVIARMTVELGHHFGLVVVAEGVEDEQTLRGLQQMGYDVAQGFHVGRPMPADVLATWLLHRGAVQVSRQPTPA